MVKVQFVKHFIFSFLIIFTGCEIPHKNSDGEMIVCNVYNDKKSEIILCPQLQNIQLSTIDIKKDKDLKIWFFSSENRDAVEFKQSKYQVSILEVSSLNITDGNLSYISVTPKIIGTTILMIGDINLTLTVIENIR